MKLRFAVALVLSIAALPLTASAQWGRGNNGYSGITVYEDPDFRGDSVTFRNEVPDLRQHGLNDRISSLEVNGNQAWEVCRDINFGGGCRVFQGSIENLRAEGWNDRISSMRAVGFGRNTNNNRGGVWGNQRGGVWGNQRGNYRGARLVLYDRTNFRGDARDIVSGSSNLGSLGDRARSIEVYGGTWELCDGTSRNSRCVTVSDNVSDIRSLGLRNGIATAREVGTQGRNGWWR
jgi:hypothetical protein